MRAWAEEHLRYIEWQQLSQNATDIFTKSPRNSDQTQSSKEKDIYFFNLSKKWSNKEIINYFISHSWSDNAKDKATTLSRFVDETGKRQSIKFWLDKACLDHTEQQKALQVFAHML